jgi:3-oxoacyl-[acyl-carrier protein] reductase
MAEESSRVAIVTGGSRGIGAAVSARLARDGMKVVVNFAGNTKAAEELVASIRAEGGQAIPIAADVSDSSAVHKLFDATEKTYGGVDALINAAGIMQLAKLADTDDAFFDRHVAINLKGTFNTLREAAKRMRNGGRIVNFSSSVVGLYQPTYAVYAATKGAVEAMSHVLAKELRGRNIAVNTVAPGPTATELFLRGKPQEVIDELAKLSPFERLGQPKDIANAVSFLIGPDGGWVNGQVVRINGGVV